MTIHWNTGSLNNMNSYNRIKRDPNVLIELFDVEERNGIKHLEKLVLGQQQESLVSSQDLHKNALFI